MSVGTAYGAFGSEASVVTPALVARRCVSKLTGKEGKGGRRTVGYRGCERDGTGQEDRHYTKCEES